MCIYIYIYPPTHTCTHAHTRLQTLIRSSHCSQSNSRRLVLHAIQHCLMCLHVCFSTFTNILSQRHTEWSNTPGNEPGSVGAAMQMLLPLQASAIEIADQFKTACCLGGEYLPSTYAQSIKDEMNSQGWTGEAAKALKPVGYIGKLVVELMMVRPSPAHFLYPPPHTHSLQLTLVAAVSDPVQSTTYVFFFCSPSIFFLHVFYDGVLFFFRMAQDGAKPGDVGHAANELLLCMLPAPVVDNVTDVVDQVQSTQPKVVKTVI